MIEYLPRQRRNNKMANKFVGIDYPITDNNPGGLFAASSDVEQIKADMLILLLTNPGERCMLPDFGTPLRDLIFEPNDASLTLTAKQMIATSLQKYEPRVSISQINVSTNVDPTLLDASDNLTELNHVLSIQIKFIDPNNIQSVQDLLLEVPLQTGGQ